MQQGLPFYRSKTFHRKKIMVMFTAVFLALLFLMGRLVYLMVFCSEYYGQKAQNLHFTKESEASRRREERYMTEMATFWLITRQSVLYLLSTARLKMRRQS